MDGKAPETPLDSFTAVMICEGVYDADEDETIRAWQHLIRSAAVRPNDPCRLQTPPLSIRAGVCHQRIK